MISFKRSNPLQPEKESTVQLDLTPLLFFVVGYAAVRSLLRAVKTK